jgi:hypothetical protein
VVRRVAGRRKVKHEGCENTCMDGCSNILYLMFLSCYSNRTCSRPVWSRMSKNWTPPISRFLSTHPQTTMREPTSWVVTEPAPCVRPGQVS